MSIIKIVVVQKKVCCPLKSYIKLYCFVGFISLNNFFILVFVFWGVVFCLTKYEIYLGKIIALCTINTQAKSITKDRYIRIHWIINNDRWITDRTVSVGVDIETERFVEINKLLVNYVSFCVCVWGILLYLEDWCVIILRGFWLVQEKNCIYKGSKSWEVNWFFFSSFLYYK